MVGGPVRIPTSAISTAHITSTTPNPSAFSRLATHTISTSSTPATTSNKTIPGVGQDCGYADFGNLVKCPGSLICNDIGYLKSEYGGKCGTTKSNKTIPEANGPTAGLTPAHSTPAPAHSTSSVHTTPTSATHASTNAVSNKGISSSSSVKTIPKSPAYVGCFKDNSSQDEYEGGSSTRQMEWISTNYADFMTPEDCFNKAKAKGYKYMGLQWPQGNNTYQCFGSNDLSTTTHLGCCDPNPTPPAAGQYKGYTDQVLLIWYMILPLMLRL